MLATLGYAIARRARRGRRARPRSGWHRISTCRPRRPRSTCSPSCARSGQRNRVMKSMIGLGYYATHTPQVVLRKVLENPAWYTAYTPYQPEISQGRLEALLNFQTMVADLSGLPAANASLLDESTAAAEAMAICRRVERRRGAAASSSTPTACRRRSRSCRRAPSRSGSRSRARSRRAACPTARSSALLLQYPGASGALRDHEPRDRRGARARRARRRRERSARRVLCRPPGEIGADIVVGSSQRFGVPPAYGGPHAALHVRPLGPRAPASRPPRRRLDRRRRRARAAARAADPRAAHPPREGDLQHLHGTGAARRDGVDVRRLPRARRPRVDREPRAPLRRRSSPRASGAAGLELVDTTRSSTRSRSASPTTPTR